MFVGTFILLYLIPNILGDERIVNGGQAQLDQFPFMVYLMQFSQYVCSGTLIDPEWVLSLASCGFYGYSAMVNGTEVNITNYVPHPDYTFSSGQPDLALYHLEIRQNSSTVSLGIPSGNNVTIVSFGDSGHPLSYITDVAVISLKICQNFWSKFTDFTINDDNLCTRSYDLTQGVSWSDNGGAIIDSGSLIAVVQGKSERLPGFPDFHAKIQNYIEWINDVIANSM